MCRFVVTPSRKHIGRAAARNSKCALVTEVLKNEGCHLQWMLMAAYMCWGLMGKMITIEVAIITLTYICVNKGFVLSSPRNLRYKLVGDNLDKGVKTRYMRSDDAKGYRNKSLHYLHSFAIQNRIDLSNIHDVHPSSCLPSSQHRASTLLPSHDDDVALQNHFARDFKRIVVKNIPYFQHTFEDIVE